VREADVGDEGNGDEDRRTVTVDIRKEGPGGLSLVVKTRVCAPD